MNSMLLHLWLLFPMAANDFLRGPNWETIIFLEKPVKWALGLILALGALYAIFKLVMAIVSLAGADRNKAKHVGETAAYALVTLFLIFTFQDFIGTFLTSLA